MTETACEVLITEGDGAYLESGPDFMSLAAD
jgi:hypothetical protein